MSIELAAVATSAFAPGEAHAPLLALAGRWSGPTVTWLDPSSNPPATHTEAEIQPILGGRVVRAAYTGTVATEPHAGEFLLTFDQNEGHFAMAWVDSFHLGTGLMFAPGGPTGDGALAFLGSYACGGERWGWRTSIRLVDANTVIVSATNIAPDGTEHRAVETRLSRQG